MVKKLIVTAVLVSLVLFLQSGCKSQDTDKTEVTEQPKAAAVTPTPAPVTPTPAAVTPKPAVVTPTPAPVTPAPAPVTPAPAAVTPKPAAPATGGSYVLRVNCGSFSTTPYTDKAGKVWQADQEYSDTNKWGAQYGQTIERPGLNIPNTDCPIIYESERYSMEGYKFLVPNGKYTVILHFAETYDGITGPGMRVYNVSLNGKTILENFDPYKEAGDFNKPSIKTYKSVEVADGQILIGFKSNIENPQICGIEILSE